MGCLPLPSWPDGRIRLAAGVRPAAGHGGAAHPADIARHASDEQPARSRDDAHRTGRLGQDFLPNRIGIANGVTLGLAASAGGIAAPLFGLLADSYGLPTALCAIAAFPAAACALTFMLRDPRPRSDGTAPADLTG